MPRPMAVHKKIVDHYARLIRSGELQPGEKLPTMRELAEQFGCGQTAVHVALVEMQAMGLTVGVPGSGTYVADPTDAG